jgi:Fe-S cluster assembly ATPase SufC
MMLTIRLKNVKRKGHLILKEINLKVDKGIYLLVGPNGSGKTTLLRTLAGDESIEYEGEILLNKENITHLPPEERVKRGLVYVFQEVPNVEATPSLILEFQGKKKRGGLWEKPFTEMSGGQKKIADFMLALELNPEVLLVDEIDSNLDEENRNKVAQRLIEASKERGILLVTHTKEFAKKFPVKKIFRIEDGKL